MLCPRPRCGGFLLERDVVTSEGETRETYCPLCARVTIWVNLAPYAVCRPVLSPSEERALQAEAAAYEAALEPVPEGNGDTSDSELSPVLREALRHAREPST